MSRFDPDKYINYQKLAENLKLVRDRYASILSFCYHSTTLMICLFKHTFRYCSRFQVAGTFDPGREDHLQSP